ncbi:MAG TPA: DinB family protein [Jatrophihabitans sp.]|nr:DinB family protein [Jatrophihabitans sp.]
MTTTAELMLDGYGRVKEAVHEVLDGLDESALTVRLDPDANTIAWLIWHLTRVQDDHVAAVAGTEQVWATQGWADRFALPFDRAAIGYGHTSDEVGQVTGVSPETLAGYYDDVHAATVAYVQGLGDADLDRVIDTRWDPPVTLGVRLVSVISDDLQHVGQAAFLRGVIERS